MKTPEEWDKIISEYENQAVTLFWQWARFPENQTYLPNLGSNKALIDMVLRLAWDSWSSTQGVELFQNQRKAMLEVIEKK